MADEGKFYSCSTEPEYEDWWNQFGPALDADSRMSRESMAFAGFCAGIARGRKETHDLHSQLAAMTRERDEARLMLVGEDRLANERMLALAACEHDYVQRLAAQAAQIAQFLKVTNEPQK